MDKTLIFKPSIIAIVTGLILGALFSYLHYKLIEFTMDDAISSKVKKYDLLLVLLTVAKPIVLVIPLLLAVLVPKVISILAVFIGVLLQKGFVMIMVLKKKD